MNDILDAVRQHDPRFNDVPDAELQDFLARRHPEILSGAAPVPPPVAPSARQSGGFAALLANTGGPPAAAAANGENGNLKQLQAWDKTFSSARDALYHSTPSVGDKAPKIMGYTDLEWKSMSSRQRVNVGQGFMQALAAQKIQQEMASAQTMQRYHDMMTAGAMQSQQASQQAGGALSDYANLLNTSAPLMPRPGMIDSTTGNYTPAAALAQSLRGRPLATASPQFDNSLQAFAKLAGSGDASRYTVKEGQTATGTPWVTYGHNFQFDPSATQQLKSDSQIKLLEARLAASENKNLLPPGTKLARDESGIVVATTPDGFIKTLGHINDLQALLGGLTGGGGGKEPSGKSPAPAAAPALRFRKNPKTGAVEQY